MFKKIIFPILFLSLSWLSVQSQTYNPSLHVTINAAIGEAQAAPLDARSMFYDGTNFVYRPYQSVNEVYSYLNLSKYRAGNVIIVIDSGGTLQSNGTYLNGSNTFWMFKDSTSNAGLIKMSLFGSNACSACLLIANNLSDLNNVATARSNLGLGAMALLGTTAGGDLSGTYPNPTVAKFNGQLPSFYLNYNNLTNPPTIPAQFNPIQGTGITLTGTYPNITFSATGGGGACLNCNADSIQTLPVVMDSIRNGLVLTLDTFNGRWVPRTGSPGGSISLTSNATRGSSPTFSANILNIDTLRYAHIFNIKDFGAVGDGIHDDSGPIQAAINAAAAYKGSEVYCPNGVYLIADTIQTNIGGYDMNAQLYVPMDSDLNKAVNIVIEGEGSPTPGSINMQSPFSTTIPPKTGVVFLSNYAGTRSTANKGTSIIGTAPAVSTGFNYNGLIVKNISFLVLPDPNGAGPEIGGVNAKNTVAFRVENCSFDPDTTGPNFTTPIRDISGFETPENGGGANYVLRNISVSGLKWGIIGGEHFDGAALVTAMCINGFGMKQGFHDFNCDRCQSDWDVNGIGWYPYSHSAGGSPSNLYFRFTNYDLEYGFGNAGKYYNTIYGVNDSINILVGDIFYSVTVQGIGNSNASWTQKGGNNLQAIAIGNQILHIDNSGQLGVTNNFNNFLLYKFSNPNTGSSAGQQIQIFNGTNALSLGMFGSGNPGSGIQDGLTGFVYSNQKLALESGSDVNVSTDNGTTNFLHINNAGNILLNNLKTGGSAPTTTGTTAMVITDANGQLSFGTEPASGTWTPSVTTGTNVSAGTGNACTYIRVGNVISFAGSINLTVTLASTASSADISIPVSSTFTAITDGNGTVGSNTALGVNPLNLLANTSSGNTLHINFGSGASTGGYILFFSGQYLIH